MWKEFLIGAITLLYIIWVIWRERNGITDAPWDW